MSTGKMIIGVMSGLAAGAAMGILFAPDKGSATRKKITKKGEDYADALKGKFNEFIDEISDKMEELKLEASDVAMKGKARLNEVKRNLVTSKN